VLREIRRILALLPSRVLRVLHVVEMPVAIKNPMLLTLAYRFVKLLPEDRVPVRSAVPTEVDRLDNPVDNPVRRVVTSV